MKPDKDPRSKPKEEGNLQRPEGGTRDSTDKLQTPNKDVKK